MKLQSFKTLALVTSALIGIGFATSPAMAADNDDMDASITTSSTITAVTGAVMDFGSWLIGIPSGSLTTTMLVMDPITGVVDGTTNKGAGHQISALPGAQTAGTVLVTLPTGSNGITLQMSHGALTPALGAGLVLSDISYYNPDTPAQTGPMVPGTQYPITIVTGATGVAVQFGGTISATAAPTDGAHGETFNVAFAY